MIYLIKLIVKNFGINKLRCITKAIRNAGFGGKLKDSASNELW
jgi:hypothetical protein